MRNLLALVTPTNFSADLVCELVRRAAPALAQPKEVSAAPNNTREWDPLALVLCRAPQVSGENQVGTPTTMAPPRDGHGHAPSGARDRGRRGRPGTRGGGGLGRLRPLPYSSGRHGCGCSDDGRPSCCIIRSGFPTAKTKPSEGSGELPEGRFLAAAAQAAWRHGAVEASIGLRLGPGPRVGPEGPGPRGRG